MTSERISRTSAIVFLKLLLASSLLISLSFFDVLFLGASLRPSDVGSSHIAPTLTVSALGPQRDQRRLYHGYNDIGTSVWGLEAGQIFLQKTFESADLPYWNPFSSAGEIGVESLTDSKFSTFSILTALFGGSSQTYNFVYLGLLLFNLYFLFLVFLNYFHLGILSACAGGLVYLLGGFHTSNITNILVLPFTFFPFLLHSTLRLQERGSVGRFLCCVLAHIFVLSPLFPPSTIFTFVFVYGCSVLIHWKQSTQNFFRALYSFWRVIASGIVALLFLSPIIVPMVLSWSYVETFAHYASRQSGSANPAAIISILSPKHFWESYNSFELYRDHFPGKIGWTEASWLHHIGVVSLFCIAFAFMQWRQQGAASKLLLGTLLLFFVSGIGRALNFPPFTQIDALPILQSIQPGYWGCLVAMSACILVSMGVERLQEEDLSREALRISIFVSTLLIAMFVAIGFVIDWKVDAVTTWYIGIFTLLCLVIPLLLACQQKYLKIPLAIFVVLLLFSELFFYLNTTRPQRSELPPTDKHFVLFADQVQDANFRTLSVGRGDLPPEWGVAYGIHQADGFRESVLPWYKGYFYKAFGRPSQDLSFDVGEELTLQLPLANYLGVKHFIVSSAAVKSLALMHDLSFPVVYEDARVKVFENPLAQPRARLLFDVKEGAVPSEDQNGSFLKTVYSNDASFLRAAKGHFSVQAPSEKSGQATILEESNMRVLVNTRSDSASILSLADAWHPNWEAQVDGERANIGLINDAFRGVALTPGEHIVEFSYRIPGANFIHLFLVGGCALFVFISFLLWNTSRKRLG